ncbi:MAG: ABC transporter permease [Faecalibacterium sp.]|nr:ABC transporter permease [Ruminococcus sp.]MCM1392835.1 ABC transporter permease [Ruminococcus sp.]MCM1486542.1 ABC transporter permease [Faecalibacterium sp.]
MNIFRRYTLQSLKKNKTRTIVTIIGIILSVAMFTATTEALVSAQNYMLNYTAKTTGSYYFGYDNVDKDTLGKIRNDAEFKDIAVLQSIGYANIGSSNEGKPYLFIAGMDDKYTDLVPIGITSGRLPENENEIVVSGHVSSNGDVDVKLGDTLELEVGQRVSDGYTLWQNQMLLDEEKLTDTVKKTYTVVGLSNRPAREIEPYDAPGYTAYTLASKDDAANSSVFITTRHIRDVKSFISQRGSAYGDPNINTDYLTYSGVTFNDGLMILLYGFGAILILLIMFGSISLIYNSFSISVSERTKQFGLLKSIGATKKQMMHSVYFEAGTLCLIAVPFGLISGCAGIAVTFACLGDKFDSFLGRDIEGLSMTFHFAPIALVAAALISILTTFISAYIPAKRAIKITAIEAIRQSTDINTKAKKVKTSKLTYKLFGFEGMIASKNFKRNKKRYRTTVISLFVSIVLFITASSFCSYFSKSFEYERGATMRDYDISVDTAYSDEKAEPIYKDLSAVDGINESTVIEYFRQSFFFRSSDINKEYLDIQRAAGIIESDFREPNVDIMFIEDEEFKKLLADNGLKESDFMNSDKPMALLFDNVQMDQYDKNNKLHHYLTSVFDFEKYPADIEARYYPEASNEGYQYYSVYDIELKNGKVYYNFEEVDEQDSGKVNMIAVEESECGGKMQLITIGAKIKDEAPYFIPSETAVIYPKSAKKSVSFDGSAKVSRMYLKADDPIKVEEQMNKLLQEKGIEDNVGIYNYAEEMQKMRSLVTIIRVFSYGFITLISLIAAANVFNTISTNIGLRRREFAMLKSVGMTPKGFNRMMNFESLLYGFKSLLFGLPFSILTTYGIYLVTYSSGMEFDFYVPWGSFAAAIISVFAVVFSSMIYSMQKIKKDNPIDALKNENL